MLRKRLTVMEKWQLRNDNRVAKLFATHQIALKQIREQHTEIQRLKNALNEVNKINQSNEKVKAFNIHVDRLPNYPEQVYSIRVDFSARQILFAIDQSNPQMLPYNIAGEIRQISYMLIRQIETSIMDQLQKDGLIP